MQHDTQIRSALLADNSIHIQIEWATVLSVLNN